MRDSGATLREDCASRHRAPSYALALSRTATSFTVPAAVTGSGYYQTMVMSRAARPIACAAGDNRGRVSIEVDLGKDGEPAGTSRLNFTPQLERSDFLLLNLRVPLGMLIEETDDGAIVVDGVNYPLSEMNGRQLYLISQLQEIQTEKKRAIAVLDRLNVTESGFTSLLKETLADASTDTG